MASATLKHFVIPLILCLAVLTPRSAHAQGWVNISDEVAVLLVAGGLAAFSTEVLALSIDVRVSVELARGRGVSRPWSILGAVLWSLNLAGAIATTAAYSSGGQPIGLELSVVWLGVSAASLALNIAGVSRGPLVVPTLLPGPHGSFGAGMAMGGHW